jgi:hypothetical protein
MEDRSDDLARDDDLPQPGTEEPKDGDGGDSTEGPGNVSVDEPTEPALDAESLDDLPSPPGGDKGDEDDTGDDDDDETSGDKDG